MLRAGRDSAEVHGGSPAGGSGTGIGSREDLPALAQIRLYTFLTRFGWAGTEGQVMGLVRNLDRDRFDVEFGCTEIGDHVALAEDGERWEVSEYPIRTFRSARAVRQTMRLARDLRKRRPDVLHTYNFYANVFSIPAARMAGVPCIVASIRDMGIYLTAIQARVQRQVCALADCVLVNAHAIRTRLVAEGYQEDKIQVIKNGIDAARFLRPRGADGVRAELGIPAHAPIVLMVSRLNPEKGVESLLYAARQILRANADTWFVFAGDVVMKDQRCAQEGADYLDRLRRLTQWLGIDRRVIFAGLRRDVPALLAQASVSVLPSLSEGLPNSVMEAMAAGVPVVATRVGGIPELIRHGHDGLLVPPDDVGALVTAIDGLLCNPYLARRLGERARERIQTEFAFDKRAFETEVLYRSILATKRRYRARARGGRA